MGIAHRILYATNIDREDGWIFLSAWKPILKDNGQYYRDCSQPIGGDMEIPNVLNLTFEDGIVPVKVVKSDAETGLWTSYGNENLVPHPHTDTAVSTTKRSMHNFFDKQAPLFVLFPKDKKCISIFPVIYVQSLVHFTPFHITAVERFDQKLGTGQISRYRDIMHVAKLTDITDIGFVRFGTQWIPQENNQIDLIMLYLSTYLLLSSQMTGEKFVYVKIRNFLDQPSRSSGGIEVVLCKYTLISYAEILHKLLLSIVCYQRYVHEIPSLVRIEH